MDRQLLIDEIIRLSKLDPDCDRMIDSYADYRERLNTYDVETLENIHHNKRCYLSPAYERAVNREIARMDKAGLYDIGNLSPSHALD